MPFLLCAVAGLIAALAFPPYGVWPLAIIGPGLFLLGLERVDRPARAAWAGFAYGLSFFGLLIWWISELGIEAVVALVVVQSLYPAIFAYLLVRMRSRFSEPWRWLLVAGLWGVTEFVRYRFPVGGFEWGGLGYSLSDLSPARDAARWIGTSGLTLGLVSIAAGALSRTWRSIVPVAGVVVVAVGASLPGLPTGPLVRVAIVQGSTPCPFDHCPDERLITYVQHLELTRTIPSGRVDLVVWSEGSTGSSNADPVNNPEVGESIAAQAERLGSWMLVGSDRPISETEWFNANVVFSSSGEIVGEYRKRHPVPFGEYIPLRSWLDWIPVLSQVPRDMIRGDGPVLFPVDHSEMGSVISFEGSFARYPRQTANAGADYLVIATNEGSYGLTPVSDQFIGMTRMRSAETGLDVVHSAVTGKSVFITQGGRLGDTTELGTLETLYGEVTARSGYRSPYVRFGEWVLAVTLAGVLWLGVRRSSHSP